MTGSLEAQDFTDTLRQAFAQPGRLERVVEVTPVFPDDIIAALKIHSADTEKHAGRPLFQEIDWQAVTQDYHHPASGDWVHILHATLRRKARCEAAGETSTPVTTRDLRDEVARFKQANSRLAMPKPGTYV